MSRTLEQDLELLNKWTEEFKEQERFNEVIRSVNNYLLSYYDAVGPSNYEKYLNVIANSQLGLPAVSRPVFEAFMNYREVIEEYNLIVDGVV